MRVLGKLLVILGISVVLSSPAQAGWKDKIVKNQFKAVDYIESLKSGADPDRISRPDMRRDEKARASAANREIRQAMSEAERLARQGRHDLIEIPVWQYELVSDGYRKDLQEEFDRRHDRQRVK